MKPFFVKYLNHVLVAVVALLKIVYTFRAERHTALVEMLVNAFPVTSARVEICVIIGYRHEINFSASHVLVIEEA